MTIAIVTYHPKHFAGIEILWQSVFPDDPPWNRAELAIPAKQAVQPELFLVALDGGRVVGSTMAGWDGHRGWLYAVAVLPSHGRRGIARLLVTEALARLEPLGCRKVNLQVRAGNDGALAFWKRLGFEVEERVSLGRRLHAA